MPAVWWFDDGWLDVASKSNSPFPKLDKNGNVVDLEYGSADFQNFYNVMRPKSSSSSFRKINVFLAVAEKYYCRLSWST